MDSKFFTCAFVFFAVLAISVQWAEGTPIPDALEDQAAPAANQRDGRQYMGYPYGGGYGGSQATAAATASASSGGMGYGGGYPYGGGFYGK